MKKHFISDFLKNILRENTFIKKILRIKALLNIFKWFLEFLEVFFKFSQTPSVLKKKLIKLKILFKITSKQTLLTIILLKCFWDIDRWNAFSKNIRSDFSIFLKYDLNFVKNLIFLQSKLLFKSSWNKL